MNKTTLWTIISIVLLVGIGWIGYNNMRSTPGPVPTTTDNTKTSTVTPPGTLAFPLAIIAQHNSASSCYSAISGKVYNLTEWISLHPGGKEAILSICGKDGTKAFMNQHHGAQKQMDILAKYYIGVLAQ